MKKLLSQTKLFFVLLMAVIIAGCSTNGKTVKNYTDYIPDSVALLASIDVKQLRADANLTPEQNDQLESFLGDVKFDESGLNPDSKPYIFIDNKGNLGMLFEVDDIEKIKKLILDKTSQCEVYKESNGFSFIRAEEMIIATKGKVLLCMSKLINETSTVSIETVIEDIINGVTKTMSKDAVAARILKSNSDIATFADLNNIKTSQFSNLSQFGTLFSDLNFEKGLLTASVELLNYKNPLADMYHKVKGSHDKYIPSSSLIYMTSSFKANGDTAMINNALRTQLALQNQSMPELNINNQIMMDYYSKFADALAYMDGDFTFAVTSYTGMIPQMVMFFEVSGKEVLPLINKYAADLSPQKVGEDQYQISVPMIGIKVNYGLINNTLYFTNDLVVIDNLRSGKAIDNNFGSTPFAAQIKNSYGGVEIKIADICKTPLVASYLSSMRNIPVLDKLDKFEVLAKTLNTSETKLIFKDKEKNSLNILFTDLLSM